MQRLMRNPEIIWRTEKRREQAVLEALEKGQEAEEQGTVTLIIAGMMHQLNLVGGQIWSLCDGTRSLDQLVDLLAEEYRVEREELADDVTAFVADLVEKGWLTYA